MRIAMKVLPSIMRSLTLLNMNSKDTGNIIHRHNRVTLLIPLLNILLTYHPIRTTTAIILNLVNLSKMVDLLLGNLSTTPMRIVVGQLSLLTSTILVRITVNRLSLCTSLLSHHCDTKCLTNLIDGLRRTLSPCHHPCRKPRLSRSLHREANGVRTYRTWQHPKNRTSQLLLHPQRILLLLQPEVAENDNRPLHSMPEVNSQ